MKPPLQRVPGTAIFLNRGKTTAPLAMRANVEHNHILHENVIILSLETRPVPHVPAAKRIVVDDLGYKDDRITHVTARFGYMDDPNVPALLPLIRKADIECRLDDDRLSYFLSTIELHKGNTPGMSRWRKRLFLATAQITADAAEYFHLPRDRTVIMGSAWSSNARRRTTRQNQPRRLKKPNSSAIATSSVPSPSSTKVSQLPMCLTIQPKFWPKEPVAQVSGRKIVAITASCLINELSRFETVERQTSIVPLRSSR